MSVDNSRRNGPGVGAVILVLFCIFGAFIGVLLVFWGLITIGAGSEGIDDLKLYSGKLKIVAPAKDEALGLTDMGPVIVRSTEMYQYMEEDVIIGKNGHKGHIMAKGFSPIVQGDVVTYATEADARKGDGNKKTYHNPEFPKAFLSEQNYGYSVLFGEVEIGDKGVKLGADLMEKFFSDNKTILLEESKNLIPAYNDPENAGKKYHLLHTGKGKYASRKDKKWKIGDLKVTYKVLKPELLEGEFTAVGVLSKDKTLNLDYDRGEMYRGKVSMEEASKDYKTSNYTSGIIFCLVGLIFIVVGIVIIIVTVRRR